MGKNHKYIMNDGLAFAEDKMMKKLSEMANEGWILEKVTLMRFKLVKSEPQDLIYSVDCNRVKKNDKEYFELFEESGWTHVCSLDYLHFFSATVDTVPIYTDKDTETKKYEGTRKGYSIALALSILTLIIISLINKFAGVSIENSVWEYVLIGLAMLSAGIGTTSLMVTVALYLRYRKSKKSCGNV